MTPLILDILTGKKDDSLIEILNQLGEYSSLSAIEMMTYNAAFNRLDSITRSNT